MNIKLTNELKDKAELWDMHVPDPNMMLLIVSSVNGLCNGGMQLKGELLYCLDFKKTFDIIPMVILWGKNKETEETNGLYHLLYSLMY